MMKFIIYLNDNLKKNLFIKIPIFIIILLCLISIINKSNITLIFKQEEEFDNIEKYLQLCNKSNINELHFSKKIKNPKVSIISPIYNRGKYLLRFLKSIQYQNFKDIEIILIDDCSSDNTLDLIKTYQNIDYRIILIKNKKNSGTFKSRNVGILSSKGEFVILPDPDDILEQNSLQMFYTFATKYNYEMLRFNIYFGNRKIFISGLVNRIKSREVLQPELKTFIYYAAGILMIVDYNVTNKFIKRIALIRALNMLGKEYLNIYMITCEDQLLNYILHRTVKSYYFLKKIGYYYITNDDSITRRQFNSNNTKNIFINLKTIFNFSKNNDYEKNMFNIFFRDFVIGKSILNRTNLLKENTNFYINAIDTFLENEFISINNRDYMIQLKQKLLEND